METVGAQLIIIYFCSEELTNIVVTKEYLLIFLLLCSIEAQVLWLVKCVAIIFDIFWFKTMKEELKKKRFLCFCAGL